MIAFIDSRRWCRVVVVAEGSLKVVVCIKQVPEGDLSPEIASQMGLSPRQDIVYLVNDLDLQAIEQAVQLKESGQAREIILLSLGPERVEEALYAGLAMGADRAIQVVADDRNWSAQLTSSALAKVIRGLECDLILCGYRSSDGGSASVGPMVAELLGLPQVTAVCRLEISPDLERAIVCRRLEKGRREIVECKLPALFTVADGLNEPRYASLMALKRARQKALQRLTLEDLGSGPEGLELSVPLVQMVACSSPRPRPKPIFVPGGDLPAHERIRLLLAGAPDKQGSWLEGEPDEVAEHVARFLEVHGIITKQDQRGRL